MASVTPVAEAFLIACEKNDIDRVKELLPNRWVKEVFVNPILKKGSALEITVRNGSYELLEILLVDGRAKVSEVFYWGCCYGDLELVQELLASYEGKENLGLNLGFYAAGVEGRINIVKLLLLNSKLDPSGCNNGALYWCCLNGNEQMARILLDDLRVDPNYPNNLPIGVAGKGGNLNIVKMLLAHPKIKPNEWTFSTIYWPWAYRHYDVVTLLLGRMDLSLANMLPISSVMLTSVTNPQAMHPSKLPTLDKDGVSWIAYIAKDVEMDMVQ